jgi:hypothetical protein
MNVRTIECSRSVPACSRYLRSQAGEVHRQFDHPPSSRVRPTGLGDDEAVLFNFKDPPRSSPRARTQMLATGEELFTDLGSTSSVS